MSEPEQPQEPQAAELAGEVTAEASLDVTPAAQASGDEVSEPDG